MKTGPVLASLVAALSLSSTAHAAEAAAGAPALPKGWVMVETLGFKMAVPGDYVEFYTFKKSPRRMPHLGNWGFMSPHATRKIFVRVSELKPGTPAELLAKTEHHLKRKVGGLRKLKSLPIEVDAADEKGRDGVIGFYEGVMHAKSRTTKSLAEYNHFIIRAIVRYPKYKTQVSLTHMIRGDRLGQSERSAAAEDFFLKQAETLELRSPAQALKLAKPILKKHLPPAPAAKKAAE